MKKIAIGILLSFPGTIALSQVLPKEPVKQPVKKTSAPINQPKKIKQPEPAITESQSVSEPAMVRVEGGSFTMGCTSEQGDDCNDFEKPAHQVSLSGYLIGKYEVTQAEWQDVMGNNPSENKGCDNCPVENISWNEVQDFIQELNAKTGKHYRLPTEEEWEYAARGGSKSKGYKYSGGFALAKVAWYNENSGGNTHPVGQKEPNELGIYDMNGNVWERCSDWYGKYGEPLQTEPREPSVLVNRVIRGGSCQEYHGNCRVAKRNYYRPGFYSNIGLIPSSFSGPVGFRLVLVP